MPLFGPRRGRGVFAMPRALIGSAAPADKNETANLTRLHQPWQAQIFQYYNSMGECWNPAQFVGRALAKARLYAAVPDPDKAGEMKEVEEGWAFDLVSSWSEIPSFYGRLMALIGEGRLTQSLPLDAADGDEPVWEYLSPTELVLIEEGKKIQRLVGAEKHVYTNLSRVDGGGDPIPGEMRMWRFWRPHPENSGMADSAFRGVKNLYEQLWWLTLSERADLRNRVVNQGILLVPEEIEFEEDDAEDAEAAADDPDLDPVQAKLHEMLSAAMEDPGSAPAASPGVIRGPGEWLHPDFFRHIRFHDPSSSLYVSDREKALILRIAQGLDMPVEEVVGSGGLNHWNAWKLDDDRFQHVQPFGEKLGKDLTDVVLRPIGRANNETDAETVTVMIDWAELVSDPDKGKTALALQAIGAIGYPATRAANDFDETDAQTPEEHLEFLAIQLKDAALVGGTPADTGDTSTTDPGQNEEPPAEPSSDPNEADPAAADGPSANASADLTTRIILAAAQEARATTGRFVLSKRRSCPSCFEDVGPVEPQEVIAALGQDRIQQIGETAANLTSRCRDRFFAQAVALGYPISEDLAVTVEMWFARNLWSRKPDYAQLVSDLALTA